ncbi:hypothetical protein L1987_48605 [Smallanthus sonchifolius]|uniref:Uncharacterized protein n=1 Tax=Smallanthus sonchifolius TaxID=185202 RepID=A0ACB9FS87_9ASTR|nr:hypothetical protein L1987_48605 [Smallanthus sonchifolius]
MGESANCYDHAYPQVQPYAEYITKEELNTWCKEANEQYEKDIQALITRIGSHRPKNLERVVYDHEGNEIGIETALGELILTTPSLETIMDDVQITVTEGEAKVPPPGNSSTLNLNSDEFYTDSLQDHEIYCDTLHLSYENELVQDDSDDDTMQESHETPEPETIMDIKVPPPVQQDIEPNFWCPTPWNIDDGFWNDDEDVIEEEEFIEIPKTPIEDECFEEGLARLFETDDDSESQHDEPIDESLVEMKEEEQV